MLNLSSYIEAHVLIHSIILNVFRFVKPTKRHNPQHLIPLVALCKSLQHSMTGLDRPVSATHSYKAIIGE